ncbi:MAG TPA: type II secretion system F family protein [Candidatus Deferrimicrobiaceae bacterium]|jgi:type IV pilus assembly protein PilC|nr:type II secretion system F family protein [Candidatus Deferrimicrobiaceae bacterium]
MAKFMWEGKTRVGGTMTGEIEAPNEAFVIAQLRRQQIVPVKVKTKPRDLRITLPWQRGKVSKKELAVFTRQFATMIDAGLPLVQCLDILGMQQENDGFKKVILRVKEDVESGSTFADALGKHPRVFDDLFVNLVSAGEVGGILDTILARLAAYIEKAMKLGKQIKSAMVYPSTILAVAVIVTVVLLLYVIPIFGNMFADFGQALPVPTQIVLALSGYTRKYFLVFIMFIVLVVFAIRWYYRQETGRRNIDRLLLRLPILGDLIRKIAVARFARTLATMVASGVPILEGMDIVAKSAGNKIIEEAVMKARTSISEGKTISEPLAESKVFPVMVTQMVGVGEATGALDAMLTKIADFYDDEVDAAVGALTSLLEPMLMIFLGVVIGGLVIAMYLPIFKLAGVVGG